MKPNLNEPNNKYLRFDPEQFTQKQFRALFFHNRRRPYLPSFFSLAGNVEQ